MRKAVSRIALPLLLGVVLLAPAASANLLANPGFETFSDPGDGPKPTDWISWGLTWSIDAADGNASLPPIEGSRMEFIMGPYWGYEYATSGVVQSMAATAGDIYTLAAMSYVPSTRPMANGGYGVAKIEFWDHADVHPENGEQPLLAEEIIIGDASTPIDVG